MMTVARLKRSGDPPRQAMGRFLAVQWDSGRLYHWTGLGALQDGLCVRWFAEAVERYYRRACQQLIRQRRIDRDKETGIEEKTVLRFV